MIWLYALVACVCYAVAVGLCCLWWLPLLQRFSQQWIEHHLNKLDSIALPEARIRHGLFLLELVVIPSIIFLGFKFIGIALSLTLLGIFLHMRALVLEWVIECRERLLNRQVLGFTTGVLSMARGGLGLSSSVQVLASESDMPLQRYLRQVSTDFNHGRPFSEALDAARESLRLGSFSLLVSSINCAHERGSSIEAALAGVQESLEHRDHADRQLRSKTANARMTLLILAVMPIVFLAIFSLQPSWLRQIFEAELGKKLLAVSLASMYIGCAWARKLLILK